MKTKLSCIFFAIMLAGCAFHTQSLQSEQDRVRLENLHQSWKNTPYVLGGTSRVKGADCSSFVQIALKELGASAPRTTKEQLKAGKKVFKASLRAGDLVFFKTNKGTNGLHVGIYLEDKYFLHLSERGGVRKASLENSYFKPRFIGARRYIKK